MTCDQRAIEKLGYNGAIICLKTKVGIGTAAELLSGSSRADLMMSATETVVNSWSDTPVKAGVKVGGGAFIVVARTLATLSTKKLVERIHADGRAR